METKANYVAVGAFVLACMVGLVVTVLWRLGVAFSIMPEARVLVTGGPYAYARHPLYAAEFLTIVGISMQFQQPWAVLLGTIVIVLQVVRSVFEEQVLAAAYPDTPSKRRTLRPDAFRIQDHYSPVKVTNQLIAGKIRFQKVRQGRHIGRRRGLEAQRGPAPRVGKPQAGGLDQRPAGHRP